MVNSSELVEPSKSYNSPFGEVPELAERVSAGRAQHEPKHRFGRRERPARDGGAGGGRWQNPPAGRLQQPRFAANAIVLPWRRPLAADAGTQS